MQLEKDIPPQVLSPDLGTFRYEGFGLALPLCESQAVRSTPVVITCNS